MLKAQKATSIPVYGKTQIVLSEKAFIGIVLSSIEVFKKECVGILLGIQSQGRIVVEYAIPLQAVTKRTFSEVVPSDRKELNLKKAIPELVHLEVLGDFHSHPQFGENKGTAELSDIDKDDMDDKAIEIIVAINTSKRRTGWRSTRGQLAGSVSGYNIRLAGYYKKKSGEIKQLEIVCPYAVGCNNAFKSK